MDELVPGKLYRAISDSDVVEVEPSTAAGLKLLVMPARIKNLKQLQKTVERSMRRRPDLHLVLNALLDIHESIVQKYDSERYLKALVDRINNLQNPSANDGQ
ncbi:MAG: hypothetical protein AB1589_45645 [Cyanobacteriota bacterium]